MDQIKLGELYTKIAQITIEMIPQEWDRVYLYGEISESADKAYFFYYPSGEQTPVYYHDVEDLFDINEEDLLESWNHLTEELRNLWEEFRNQGQEQWTNLTMFFDHDGNFKIDYDYEDLSEANDLERLIVWEYNHLGLVPKNAKSKAFLDQYLKNKQS